MNNPTIYVITEDPANLIASINHEIEIEKIITWDVYTTEPNSFTHKTPQWNKRGFIQAKILQGKVAFAFSPSRAVKANEITEVRAVYIGRFVEMLMAHFSTQINGISIE